MTSLSHKPIVPLLPYQKEWIEDRSMLKLAVKGRQEGYSFSAALQAFLRCVERKTNWIFLSKGERQSKLLMEKVLDHVKAAGVVCNYIDSSFMEGTSTKQLEARLPNGSIIYALPANPDTARGYSGNVTLDEFAFHTDADKIYAALYPTITRGYCLEAISTPNGKQGKFYDFCKAAGLVEGEDSDPRSPWSAHRVDIYEAVEQGLAEMVPEVKMEIAPSIITAIAQAFAARGIAANERMVRFVAALRAGVDDEDTWLQEFCCTFVSTAENFFPPELVKEIVSPDASAETPYSLMAQEPGEIYLGIDIGRRHDRTVIWADRVQNISAHNAAGDVVEKPIATTRLVKTMHKAPFAEQLDAMRQLLLLKRPSGHLVVRRCCIDATGIGAMLAETLHTEFGPRVEPVNFTGAVKEDLAFRSKRLAEGAQIRIPEDERIRKAFGAVKKTITAAGNIRFDAARTEAGHADEFWAKSLADLAADRGNAQSFEDYGAVVGRPVQDPGVFAHGLFDSEEVAQ